jgi:hypothetical protein
MLNPVRVLTRNRLKPIRYVELARRTAVRLPGGVNYAAGTVLGKRSTTTAADEVQTLTLTGTPTGGSFRLGVPLGGSAVTPTAAIAYGATAAAVQTALAAVLGTGNVAVTGGAGGPWTVTFGGDAGQRDVPILTLFTNSLTGGTSPSLTIAETTKGLPTGGHFAAYDPTASDGTQTAKFILEHDVQTDFYGNLIDELGLPTQMTVPAFTHGEFLVSELTGLNGLAVAQLGRLVDGGLDTTSPSGANEVQTVTYDSANTGGTLRLTVAKPNGDIVTTAGITWNGTDATYLASIQSALDTATGVTNGIVAGGLPDTALTLTYSGTGYAGLSHRLASVATFPTSSAAANVARTTTGYNAAFTSDAVLSM